MTHPEAAPAGPAVKIGVCLDFPIEDVRQVFLDAVRLGFDEATASAVLDRRVELVIRDVEGLPRGDAFDVVKAWQELVDAGCVGIIGPLISDNSLAVREHLASAPRKVPTLTWSGTDAQYDEYMFSAGNGSLPEEPFLIAEAIADRGLHSVGVAYERAVPGREYLEFFVEACRREGLEIVHTEALGQTDRDTAATVRRLHARRPDVLVYFGFGLPAIEMNLALADLGWDPPRYTCTAFILCYIVPDGMKAFRGWTGVDQYDETNEVGQAMQERFAARFGYRMEACIPTLAYDCANVMAHGIGQAHPLTAAGLLRGLERVKLLRAATGAPGTRMSFGPWNRRAWHGAGYLVLREVTEDALGTRLVARFRA